MTASALSESRVQDQTDSRTDQQLIAGINAGDAAAFEVLYFRYRHWVVNLAHRFTGSEDLALDVLQETFLYLLRKFPGFRLTANLKTFLYPAVRNLSIAVRRKAGRYQSGDAEHRLLEQLTAADNPPNQSRDLSAALAGLSEEHREALLLRYVDGLALSEIAEDAELYASAGAVEGSPTEASGLVLKPPAFTNQAQVRFEAADIYVDSNNKPLAAYQLELSITGADAKIVGIEGGEVPAFSEPPFYDPKAMQHERVVIAAFSTNNVARLPRGKVRVATIHFETSLPAEPEFRLKLHTAAGPDGNRIPAEASVKERQAK